MDPSDCAAMRLKTSAAWAVISLVSSVALMACRDMKESHYPSLADARRAGAVARGWLPDFLPESSSEIKEIHNIDTNQIWCAFEFSIEETRSLQQHLTAIEPTSVSTVQVRAVDVAWWPRVLQGRLDPDRIARAGLQLYRNGTMYFAIDWKAGRAFFYRAA
jgi:hypothetical protein